MRFIDPRTGKPVERSTGKKRRRDAEREAAKWERDLRTGDYIAPSRMPWSQFREMFEADYMADKSKAYWASMKSALNRLECIGFQRLSQVDAHLLSKFKATLHDDGLSPSTIRSYLKHIRAALAWAVEMELLPTVPKVRNPKAPEKMKGRPLTVEEFERMLQACGKVRPDDHPKWERYLTGLWLSGLRLGESVSLSWDEGEPFAVDLNGRHPQFNILQQKSGQQQLLPMTPDFAEWLLQTPEASRSGPVFALPVAPDAVGRVVSRIGERAVVVVDKASEKFATAHDFRRSFGTRWSQRVMPATLQKLMRHADINTTMTYYVRQQADDIASELWRMHGSGDTFGDTGPKTLKSESPQDAVTSNGLNASLSRDDRI